MKKIFTFFFAALMSASMFASPAAVPTVQDVAAAGYDVANARVICLYFDEQVCNDIVWVGTYRVNEVGNWSTNVEELSTFESLENYPGWYVVEVDDDSNVVMGKPVQLKKDGSFNWDFQSGDVEAWINMAQPGTQTGSFEAGYSGEANCTWPENGAYIYEVAYFKNHNTPCAVKPVHDYTITAYLPEFCDEIEDYADSVFIMGGFDWNKGIKMERKIDKSFKYYYYAEIKDLEEGTAFTFRCGTMNWDVRPQLNGVNLPDMITTAKNDTVIYLNGEGYSFKACAAPIEYKYTTYENWQLKHEGSEWQWTENLVKLEEGLFMLPDAYWTGSGFNVGSDANPIKKDWFAPEELVIGEEVLAPVIVDVYLRIIDNETLTIGVGIAPPVAPKFGDQFVDKASGLKFEVISVGETNSVKVISNSYKGISYIIPTSVSYGGATFSVTTIGEMAFYYCSGLTSITIPNSVTTIGESAFEGCSGLTSIDVDAANTHYASVDGVLFNYAKNTLIQYPASNPRTEYTIPRTVTTIGEMAFYYCSGLTSITIPNSVTTIGFYAFNGCSGLTSVTIPNSVTTIGSSAFSGCSGLTSINVDAANTHYTSVDGVLFNYTKDTLVRCPIGNPRKEYTIPNSVTTIGSSAFSGCSGLTSVIIPNSVTTIGGWAFSLCSGLTSVTIPNSVTTIGYNAFYGCNGLTSVTIGNSVTTIRDVAFYGCSGLTSITSYAINPPSCGTNCFNKVDKSIPVYVPFQSVLAYKQANEWKDFTNIQRNPYDYAIVSCSTKNGTISGAGKYIKGDKCTLTVTANYGYHFVQWNDGITDNPRSFILTQDTSFIAQIAVNQYTLTAQSMDTVKGKVTGGGTFDYQSLLTITATANYGYRFLKWNDGNTTNPRKLTLTQDTTFIAQFTTESYQVTVQNANPTMGGVLGSGSYPYLSAQTISATANYGYHFNQWNDSVTDNPRTIQVLGDTIFTAEFAKNQYLISVEAEHGVVSGGGYYEYQSYAQLSATADEHYHFVKWSDGNTSNPRTISVTEDKTYTAIFALDQFTISATATHGAVTGTGKYEYGQEITLTVVPDFCYEFAGWNDGNTDNPRRVTVLGNAQYSAQCKQLQMANGSCGNGVYWALDLQTGVLTISGNGAMDNYTSANQTPWYDYLSFTTFSSLIIEDGVTHIGNYAFYGLRGLITVSLPNSVATIGHHAFAECQDLEKVAFGAGLQSIGDYAFYNDIRIEEMTCLASRTPDVSANTFGNVSHFAWVYVQSEYFHKYEVNMYWNVFVLKTIEAEPAVVQEDDVTVTPSTDNATIVWPSDDAAAEYTLEITKDGVVFCTLRFNAQGQLIGIAFAPSRDGELRTMSNAEMTVNGWSFTVTGLNPGSTYSYTVDVVDAQKQSIHQYTGSFTTTGGVVTSLPTLMSTSASGKMLYNGHLYILREGNLFTATGARVK